MKEAPSSAPKENCKMFMSQKYFQLSLLSPVFSARFMKMMQAPIETRFATSQRLSQSESMRWRVSESNTKPNISEKLETFLSFSSYQLLSCVSLANKVKYYARYGADNRDYPVAHDDFLARPALRLEVVMEWRHDKYSALVEEFVNKNLDDDRSGRRHQRQGDDGQEQDRIGEKGNNRERHCKREHAALPHVETRRRHVEPEEGQYAAGDSSGKRRDVVLSAKEGNGGKGGEARGEHPARQAVEPVYD